MNLTLKPLYIVLACTAVVLPACTESDGPKPVIDPVDRQIMFHTDLPAVASRVEILDKTLPYFQVTAFNPADPLLLNEGVLDTHFADERIDVVTGSDHYSSHRCIWPRQGRETDQVTFFAFYPELHSGATLSNHSTATTIDYKLEGFSVNSDITKQVDFVTAYTTGNMAENVFSGIMLPFAHQLSRIEINAWSANKSCDIEIAGIRIGGVGTLGTFVFSETETGGAWDEASIERGIVEHIFGPEEYIVSLPNVNSGASTTTDAGAVSIMGAKVGDNNNCTLLLPSTYAAWDSAKDRRNTSNFMYISVLLRITDATPSSGIRPEDPQRYPYSDLSQGPDALSIEKEYFAIETSTGKIIKRLTKDDEIFYIYGTDEVYDLPAGEEVKEFGWAALPVTADWEPGKIYTYTLNYTGGIGLHDPEVDNTQAPLAGDPVISDRVGLTYTVKDWNDGGGSEFPVPGS